MRINEADFDQVAKVNLKSVFNMTKAIQRIFKTKVWFIDPYEFSGWYQR